MQLSRSAVEQYWFELCIIILLIIYTAFYLTPSSYGVALNLLGIPNKGLIYGVPQPIRSDEYGVWTPYLQALINNHFQRFNAFSIYHEDFRNFNALPIHDWGLIFKPQFWSFLVFEPARAFSFYHGILIASFIIGWKQVIQKLLERYRNTSTVSAILFSLLLFFSGGVQSCWTTFGPLFALLPWVLIILLSWKNNSIGYYIVLTYGITVWLLSLTYPPLIISCAYFSIFLLFAFRGELFKNIWFCIFSTLACILAVLIAFYYYKDVIKVMMETVYPGKRMSAGGEERFYLWLSSIVPYISFTRVNAQYQAIRGYNICEATSISSLLPLASLCFADIKKLKDLYSKEIIGITCAILFFSIWMLLPVPILIGKLLLLVKVQGHRMIFVLGLAFNILALSILVKQGTKLSFKRVALFTALMLCTSWYLPVYYELYKYFEKSDLELVCIVFMLLLLLLDRYRTLGAARRIELIVASALLPNLLYFSTFNPIQSAEPIFSAKNSKVVADLKQQELKDRRGWLVIPGMSGAILNGLGLRSFSHTLIQPQLAFFRKIFPELPASEFNTIFNRYAHLKLANIQRPDSPHPDVIRIPIQRILDLDESVEQHAEIGLTDCKIAAVNRGEIEEVTLDGNNKKTLYLRGWTIANEHRYLTNLKSSNLIKYFEMTRKDILFQRGNKDLPYTGFSFKIVLSDEDILLMRREGFCLFSESKKYGVNQLFNYSSKTVQAFMEKTK